MNNPKKVFIIPLLLTIIVLLVIGGGFYYYKTKNAPAQPMVQSTPSLPGFTTYSNFGITFQYPTQWGIPKESLYGSGLGSIFFDGDGSDSQSFIVSLQQDTDPQGSGILNETFDQMIARFKKNDQYIYDSKDVLADGVAGQELFYNNAVTGQPYHVEAYFPLQNNTYISIGADYQFVDQSTFDTIIATLKLPSMTALTKDPTTGMDIYSNNGIRFEYPEKFDTDYASLTLDTSVEKVDTSKLDNNGCYPAVNDSGTASSTAFVTSKGIPFCTTVSGDVGAGQLYTTYSYMTIHNGNIYTINYSVHTSNGCGVYQNSSDLTAPENKSYNECLDFMKNDYSTLVAKPIQESIDTFSFIQ